MKLPIIKAQKLWHWGSLDKGRKFERGISYEGNLFSMSACPDAWCSIGRFGASKLYSTNNDLKLLDLHTILDAKRGAGREIKEVVTQWALDNKLIEKRELFYFSCFDDELDREISFTYPSLEDLLSEHDEYEGDDPAISSKIEYIGTELLVRRHGFRASDIVGFEFAVIEWVRANVPGVHGVYWDDLLDPSGLSAPRAGIFRPENLELVIQDDVPDDEDALKSLSSIRWETHTLLKERDTQRMQL
ncbi:hypothetical protein P5704_027335 (plasmid) [Pseudomonas sp. FeN3W]|nr:hypothetical protein P5704_027335 [Pseudomonas sp. FeN3W]